MFPEIFLLIALMGFIGWLYLPLKWKLVVAISGGLCFVFADQHWLPLALTFAILFIALAQSLKQ